MLQKEIIRRGVPRQKVKEANRERAGAGRAKDQGKTGVPGSCRNRQNMESPDSLSNNQKREEDGPGIRSATSSGAPLTKYSNLDR